MTSIISEFLKSKMSVNTPDAHISFAGDHDKTQGTEIIVSAYYRLHPDAFHLSEAWADIEAYERHEHVALSLSSDLI